MRPSICTTYWCFDYSTKKFYKPLHGLIEDGRSFRNDPVLDHGYNKFRRDYWKQRAEDFRCR
ncbi:HNH/ENDO VII family nuclease [Bordetella genomosp. 13]|uniref:HNH/ENDO VII family nuclease n=1 Tax=Bordetella genomosp. 13 TaxID=463040 RepID=UPI00391F3C66